MLPSKFPCGAEQSNIIQNCAPFRTPNSTKSVFFKEGEEEEEEEEEEEGKKKIYIKKGK